MIKMGRLDSKTAKMIGIGLLILGIVAVSYSFLDSFPIVIRSYGETPFSEIQPIFWFGLAITLVSLFVISSAYKRKGITVACCALFVFFFWLPFLFFPLLPGSDSHYFRGATEYFIRVGVNVQGKNYLQWPSFFVLSKSVAEVLGTTIAFASILLFVLFGVLISTTLGIFFYNEDRKLGFIGVVLYCVGAFTFLDYQYAPQSLALAIFFMLLLLVEKGGCSSAIALVIAFTCLVFTHAFIPVFFLFFIFLIAIKSRKSNDINLFSLCFLIYIVVLVFFQLPQLNTLLGTLHNIGTFGSGEYSNIVAGTLTMPTSALDNLAQTISRVLTLVIVLSLLVGFIGRFLEQKIRFGILALAIVGLTYLVLGGFLSVLGSRSIQILFVPAVIGFGWVQKKMGGKIVYLFVVIILLLCPFIWIHRMQSVGYFQTPSGERASNFLLGTLLVNPRIKCNILSTTEDGQYLSGELPENTTVEFAYGLPYGATETEATRQQIGLLMGNSSGPSYVLCNVIFEKELGQSGLLSPNAISELVANYSSTFNVIYNDGYTFVFSAPGR